MTLLPLSSSSSSSPSSSSPEEEEVSTTATTTTTTTTPVVVPFDLTRLDIDVTIATPATTTKWVSEIEKRRSTLTSLSFHKSSIPLVLLAEQISTLSTLDAVKFFDLNFDVQEAKALQKILFYITRVTFYRVRISTPAIRYLLSDGFMFRQVQSVTFYNCGIDAEGTKYIQDALIDPNCITNNLSLVNNQIGVEGAQALANGLLSRSTSLESLYLNHNQIGNKGLECIFDAITQNPFTALTVLNLYKTGIDTNSVVYIASLLPGTKLKILNLGKNEIHNDGIIALANCLNNTQLQQLSLSDTGIGDYGAKALVQSLQSNTKLISLNLGSNSNITIDGVWYILDLLRYQNKTLGSIALHERPRNDRNAHELIEQIDFYLTLNHYGYRNVGDPSFPCCLFPLVLQSMTNRPSEIYWLLNTCPTIVVGNAAR